MGVGVGREEQVVALAHGLGGHPREAEAGEQLGDEDVHLLLREPTTWAREQKAFCPVKMNHCS